MAGADVNGQPLITARYSYDAYGMMLGGDPSLSKPAATDHLYSGEQFDPGLQQQYLRARYYDQKAGVFASLDPFGGNNTDPQSLHKYAYCHGDGANRADPSGHQGILLDIILVALVALICFSIWLALTLPNPPTVFIHIPMRLWTDGTLLNRDRAQWDALGNYMYDVLRGHGVFHIRLQLYDGLPNQNGAAPYEYWVVFSDIPITPINGDPFAHAGPPITVDLPQYQATRAGSDGIAFGNLLLHELGHLLWHPYSAVVSGARDTNNHSDNADDIMRRNLSADETGGNWLKQRHRYMYLGHINSR